MDGMESSFLPRCILVRHLPRFALLLLTYITTDVFDGAMITLAIYTLNFFHPGFLLNGPPSEGVAESREMTAKLYGASSSSLA